MIIVYSGVLIGGELFFRGVPRDDDGAELGLVVYLKELELDVKGNRDEEPSDDGDDLFLLN